MIGGGLRGTPDVVKNLLIINVLALVAGFFLGDFNLNREAGLYHPYSDQFRPFQIVTHMFLHGGIAHLFFNMFALWMLGSPLEQVWGPKRFLIYYFVTGLGAAILHLGVNHFQLMGLESQLTAGQLDQVIREGQQILYSGKNYTNEAMAQANYILNIPTVGASGAVFGILLGFGMLFPNTRLMLLFLPVPIKAKYFVMGYAALELFLGFQQNPGDNIAHFAHIGGMIFGFILIKLWKTNRRDFY